MAEDSKFSDGNTPGIDKELERKRSVWQFALANLTVLIFWLVLSLQPGLPIRVTSILTALFLLIANGAVWLGVRLGQSQRRSVRLSRLMWCFAAAGLGAALAVYEIASNDYASAGSSLSICAVAVVLGLIAGRQNAKKGSGGSER
jgi:hypothetical protein